MIAPAVALALAAATAAPLTTARTDAAGFRIVCSDRARDAAAQLAEALPAERAALAVRLGADYPGDTRVIVGDGPDEIAALAPAGVAAPRWASGLAVPAENLLLFDARAVRGERGLGLVRHELAHLGLGRRGDPDAWPRWFQEGLAMLVAGDWSLTREVAIFRASRDEQAIPLAALTRDWPDGLSEVEIAYAESLSFVARLCDERGGEERLRTLIAAVAAGTPFHDAFAATWGRSLEEVEREWRRGLASRYRWVPLLSSANALWALTSLLFVGFGLALLRRRRRRLAELERLDAQEDLAAAEPAAQPAEAEGPSADSAPTDRGD